MTQNIERQAPGCFGAASVFSMDSTYCQGCVAFKECGEAALKVLETIKEAVNVSDVLKRHQAARQKALHSKQINISQPVDPSPIPITQPKRSAKPVERKTSLQKVVFVITPAAQLMIDRIGEKNAKAKEQAIILFKQNKVKEMLQAIKKNENAFAESGPQYLRIVCDMILNGGFTKASYKSRLMSELGWTDSSAGPHVSMGVILMTEFRVVVENAGQFTLNPALRGQNV